MLMQVLLEEFKGKKTGSVKVRAELGRDFWHCALLADGSTVLIRV